MDEKYYYRVRVANLKQQGEDLLTSFCFESGAQGVSEDLSFTQSRDDYEPVTIERTVKDIDVFFTEPPANLFLDELESQFPEVKVTVFTEKDKDWMEEWKKGYKPFCLAGDYWVVPSWLESPVERSKTIDIDPGMAFGTGTHETTQLCAEQLTKLSSLTNKTLLDVGTGTGILAILARRLGAGEMLGTEIDKEACRVAKENLELNACSDVPVLNIDLAEIPGDFDIVVANIIDGILLRLQEDLVKHLKPGGTLILSGILKERESEFSLRWQPSVELETLGRNEKGDWLSFMMRRKS